MNIISFSLWGNKPMYCVGAIENIKLAQEIYPGWRCRFYVDDSVPADTIRKIQAMKADIFFVSEHRGPFYGMFWRFLTVDDSNVDVCISRDCDSRLNYREKVAVDEWLASDKGIHTMHDHNGHRGVPMLGGAWGAKKGVIKNMGPKVDKWGRYDKKGIDQVFLQIAIWPFVKDNCLRHDNGFETRYGAIKPFPKHEPLKFGGGYVGEIFDENNKPVIS
jgi:hypothetical protein